MNMHIDNSNIDSQSAQPLSMSGFVSSPSPKKLGNQEFSRPRKMSVRTNMVESDSSPNSRLLNLQSVREKQSPNPANTIMSPEFGAHLSFHNQNQEADIESPSPGGFTAAMMNHYRPDLLRKEASMVDLENIEEEK